jgi:hypothetical protein
MNEEDIDRFYHLVIGQDHLVSLMNQPCFIDLVVFISMPFMDHKILIICSAGDGMN